MKNRITYIISLVLSISALYSECDSLSGSVNDETGWCYNQSTFQAFYMFQEIQIDGLTIESGQGADIGPGDVVGAFKDGICIGWVYANSLVDSYGGQGFTTLPLMGDDGADYTAGYINTNQIPEVFIYDKSNDTILPLSIGGTQHDLDNDGVTDVEWTDYAEFSNNEIFVFYGVANAENSLGCIDASACNYDPSASIDDGSCWFATDGCDCSDGEGSTTDDCGVCNGNDSCFGCMDPAACGYNSEATIDDGSCWTPDCGCSCDDPEGASSWNCYGTDQSTFQSFYMFESIEIDNTNPEHGQSAEVGPGDLIVAYKNGVIVGRTYILEDGYSTLPLMGNDGSASTSDYMIPGDVPDSVLIVDRTYCSELEIDISNTTYTNTSGTQTGVAEYPGWTNNEIYIINGTATASNGVVGCTDSLACNYNPSAVTDDGSCWIATDGCLCENGEGAVVDECGECGGLGIPDGACDCDGSTEDCAGECGGSAVVDECGECGGDNSSCTGCTDQSANNYNEGCDGDCLLNSGCEYSADVETTTDEDGNTTVDQDTTISSGENAETDIEIEIGADTEISCEGEGCPSEGEDLEITISEFEDSLENPVNDFPDDFNQSSQIVAFEPFGLTFDNPVSIQISYDIQTRSDYIILYLSDPSADWGVVTDPECNNGLCTFSTDSFGLFTVSEVITQDLVYGCTDDSLCGYESDASYDDGSCYQQDCFGECAVDQSCNNILDIGCAYIDGCGECVGGNTGNEECGFDCNGVLGGNALWDDCGICSGGTSGNVYNSTIDCEENCDPSGDPYELGQVADEYICTTGLLIDIEESEAFNDEALAVPIFLHNEFGVNVLEMDFTVDVTNLMDVLDYISYDINGSICSDENVNCSIDANPNNFPDMAVSMDFRGVGGLSFNSDTVVVGTDDDGNTINYNQTDCTETWDELGSLCYYDLNNNQMYDSPILLFSISGLIFSGNEPNLGEPYGLSINDGSLTINGFDLESDEFSTEGYLKFLQSVFSIDATARYYSDGSVSGTVYDTEIKLSGLEYDDGEYIEFSEQTRVLDDGQSIVTFDGINRGEYELTASRYADEYDKNKISASDAGDVAQHLLGNTLITDQYRLIAADVSANGLVSALDASRIARFSIGAIDYFNSDGSFWKFVSQNLSDTIDLGLTDGVYNGNIEFLYGILLGDVSGSWPEQSAMSKVSNEPIVYRVTDGSIDIPIYLNIQNEIVGIDIIFSYDNTTLELSDISLSSEVLPDDDYTMFVNNSDGLCRVAIFASGNPSISTGSFIELSFIPLEESSSAAYSDIIISRLDFNERPTNAGFAYESDRSSLSNMARVWLDDSVLPQSLYLYQNYPNPFNPHTSIVWYQPDDSPATLTIYDISGNIVENRVLDSHRAGINSFIWDGSGFSSGIYVYMLNHNGVSYNNKMVLIK